MAIQTPAGCLATNAMVCLVFSAALAAAFRVFSAAALIPFALPALAAFAYCFFICCFCQKRERGLLVSCGLSCSVLWYWKLTFALNAAFSAFAASR